MQENTDSRNDSRLSIFERHPRLVGLLLLLLLVGLIDLVTGFFLIPANFQSFRIRDPYYHHGILPDQEVITNWGQRYYTFSSNSLGFRDSSRREVGLLPADGVRRVLFIGDSHTEAVGVGYAESFIGRLGKMTEGMQMEILNGSAVSYSPRIHYLKTRYLLEEVGLRFDALFVVIDMSDLNNEIAYERFQPKKEYSLKKGVRIFVHKLRDRSAIIYLADGIVKARRSRFFYEHMTDERQSDFELYSTFFEEFKDADLLNDPDFHNVSGWLEDDYYRDLANYSLELGQDNIARLNELCREYDIALTISVHPWPEQVLKGDTTNAYVESWRNFAVQQKIGFVNLFPVFINYTNPVITASQCYIMYDNHWNERGHELVAREFFSRLKTERDQ